MFYCIGEFISFDPEKGHTGEYFIDANVMPLFVAKKKRKKNYAPSGNRTRALRVRA